MRVKGKAVHDFSVTKHATDRYAERGHGSFGDIDIQLSRAVKLNNEGIEEKFYLMPCGLVAVVSNKLVVMTVLSKKMYKRHCREINEKLRGFSNAKKRKQKGLGR